MGDLLRTPESVPIDAYLCRMKSDKSPISIARSGRSAARRRSNISNVEKQLGATRRRLFFDGEVEDRSRMSYRAVRREWLETSSSEDDMEIDTPNLRLRRQSSHSSAIVNEKNIPTGTKRLAQKRDAQTAASSSIKPGKVARRCYSHVKNECITGTSLNFLTPPDNGATFYPPFNELLNRPTTPIPSETICDKSTVLRKNAIFSEDDGEEKFPELVMEDPNSLTHLMERTDVECDADRMDAEDKIRRVRRTSLEEFQNNILHAFDDVDSDMSDVSTDLDVDFTDDFNCLDVN